MRLPGPHSRALVRGGGLRSGAFTLLEVLLAVAIFAVVLAAINSVFYGALRLRNQMTKRIERHLPIEQAAAILKKDLLGIVPPGTLAGPLKTALGTSTTVQGEQVGPEIFTSTASIDERTPWAEVQKVTYYLRNSTNQVAENFVEGRDLFRAVTRNLLAQTEEQPAEQFLLGGVEQVAFQFYTGTEWRETWDSTTEETPLPKAIRVQLQMAREDAEVEMPAPVELVIPIVVQGATNQTQNAEAGGAGGGNG